MRRVLPSIVLLLFSATALLPVMSRAADTPLWDQTLSRIASSVVTIEVDQARAFDTEWNQSTQATGFVVDAELGLILTNRHVVTPGTGGCHRDLPEPRGSRAARGVSRSGARLRLLPVRSGQAALRAARRVAALSAGSAHRHRDPRRRQRCWRAVVDPGRHARAPRPRGARVRHRQVQRFQHLLHPGSLGHVGRLVRLAGDRHPRPRRRTECRRQQRGGFEFLPAARSRAARARTAASGAADHPRHAAGDVHLHALRRAREARLAAGDAGRRAPCRTGPHGHAGRR